MSVYSVDAGDPFLDTLAARLSDGTLWPDGRAPEDPLALSLATIYLPTRRAARALASSFLRLSGGPCVLPRIEALGEHEEETAGRPGVIGLLEARVALAALIRSFAQSLEADSTDGRRLLLPSSGPDAVRLADDLIALIDQVETQEADWADLPGLVERADLAAHWELTTRFLTIATTHWPHYLAAAGQITEANARRRDAAAAEAALADANGPIVVAGSTGSIPATRRLIRAIAAHPYGTVVLPGFDRDATLEDWATLEAAPDAPSHPQYGMKQLVDALAVAPEAVRRLAPPAAAADAPGDARRTVLRAALRPAGATHLWLSDRAGTRVDEALAGVGFVEAQDERLEAAAIAVAMREAVERGERVALITPHRPLARRVGHALRRWQIAVDDSAGEPLGATPAGVLARLLAAIAAESRAADWLALLKHPLCSALVPAQAVGEAERILRGPRLAHGALLSELASKGEEGASAAQTLSDALGPLLALARGETSIPLLASAHAQAVGRILDTVADRADVRSLADALSRLAAGPSAGARLADWPATFEALISGIVVRAPLDDDAVRILGPLEARLQAFDHTILGGLNEGVWPDLPDAGPWMSRGMMSAFGIDLPERKIGLAAHDVAMAAHAPRLTLTRACRTGGEPAVASRWWQRLLAFCGEDAEPARKRGERLIALATLCDIAPARTPAPRPHPCPPLAARPTRLSVTDVARLVRDPYALYARRVLALKPLDPIEADPQASDRGEVIHKVLKEFVASGANRAPDALERFTAIAAKTLSRLSHFPEAQALWRARLAYLAPELVALEADRAGEWAPILTEAACEALFDGVTLAARIDRLDARTDGRLDLIDYKTGTPPTGSQVTSLLEPQLALEAMMIGEGALEVPADAVIESLTYVAVGSGRVPVAWKPVKMREGEAPADLVARTRAQFLALLALYRDPAAGYLSRARISFETDLGGDYDHLARAAEWQR